LKLVRRVHELARVQVDVKGVLGAERSGRGLPAEDVLVSRRRVRIEDAERIAVSLEPLEDQRVRERRAPLDAVRVLRQQPLEAGPEERLLPVALRVTVGGYRKTRAHRRRGESATAPVDDVHMILPASATSARGGDGMPPAPRCDETLAPLPRYEKEVADLVTGVFYYFEL